MWPGQRVRRGGGCGRRGGSEGAPRRRRAAWSWTRCSSGSSPPGGPVGAGGRLQVGTSLEGEGERVAAQRCGVGEGAGEGGDQVERGVGAEAGAPDHRVGVAGQGGGDEPAALPLAGALDPDGAVGGRGRDVGVFQPAGRVQDLEGITRRRRFGGGLGEGVGERGEDLHREARPEPGVPGGLFVGWGRGGSSTTARPGPGTGSARPAGRAGPDGRSGRAECGRSAIPGLVEGHGDPARVPASGQAGRGDEEFVGRIVRQETHAAHLRATGAAAAEAVGAGRGATASRRGGVRWVVV